MKRDRCQKRKVKKKEKRWKMEKRRKAKERAVKAFVAEWSGGKGV